MACVRSGGLHLHSTLALTTQGLPLGVLRVQLLVRAKHDRSTTGEDKPLEARHGDQSSDFVADYAHDPAR
jgi:hypothetical protein